MVSPNYQGNTMQPLETQSKAMKKMAASTKR